MSSRSRGWDLVSLTPTVPLDSAEAWPLDAPLGMRTAPFWLECGCKTPCQQACTGLCAVARHGKIEGTSVHVSTQCNKSNTLGCKPRERVGLTSVMLHLPYVNRDNCMERAMGVSSRRESYTTTSAAQLGCCICTTLSETVRYCV